MSMKRSHFNVDPDYEDLSEQQNKRQRFVEEDAKESTIKKIESIVRHQFMVEIKHKESETLCVDQRLNQARSMLDRLRACIVANFYGTSGQAKSFQTKVDSGLPPSIHPANRKYIGKAPREGVELQNEPRQEVDQPVKSHPAEVERASDVETISLDTTTKGKNPQTPKKSETPISSRSPLNSPDGGRSRFKVKKRIVVGNVSKYIPVDRREEQDQSTHKWMVYVRGPQESSQIQHFVKKVWFFLHPSYRPNDLVEICQPPYHLTRRGWGEFPVRVQLHFHDQRNKRVDIIHNLKLDRTYTGLQTLGAETNVEIELEKDLPTETNAFNKASSLSMVGSSCQETIDAEVDEHQRLHLTTVEDSSAEDHDDISSRSNRTLYIDKHALSDPSSDLLQRSNSNLSIDTNTHLLGNGSSSPRQLSNERRFDDETNALHSGASKPATAKHLEPVSNVKDSATNKVPSNPVSPQAKAHPTNLLETAKFVKCIDKDGKMYLIPESMITKKTVKTNSTVSQITSSPVKDKRSLMNATASNISSTGSMSLLSPTNQKVSCSLKINANSVHLQLLPNPGINKVNSAGASLISLHVPKENPEIKDVAGKKASPIATFSLPLKSDPAKGHSSASVINSKLNSPFIINSNNLVNHSNFGSKQYRPQTVQFLMQNNKSSVSLLKDISGHAKMISSTVIKATPRMKNPITNIVLAASALQSNIPHLNSNAAISLLNQQNIKREACLSQIVKKAASANSEISRTNTQANSNIISTVLSRQPGSAQKQKTLVLNNKSQPATQQAVLANIGGQTYLLNMQSDKNLCTSGSGQVPLLWIPTNSGQNRNSASNSVAQQISKAKLLNQTLPQSNKMAATDTKVCVKNFVINDGKLAPIKSHPQAETPSDKRIHVWKNKVHQAVKGKLDQIEPINLITLDDMPDMTSLVRAAVLRHPVVSETADRNVHPYCAPTVEKWLSWNIGKRRSSEWQRASWVRKFIRRTLDGADSYKGEALWSTKEILSWCRLHAYSPHWRERPSLSPVANEVCLKSRYSSLTDTGTVSTELTEIEAKTTLNSEPEEDIDVVSVRFPKIKIKTEPDEAAVDDSSSMILLPPSDEAIYVQELTQKIGVQFKPAVIAPEISGSVVEDMIFKVMQEYMADVLRETFNQSSSEGSYPTDMSAADVHKAICTMDNTDFLTNKYLGLCEDSMEQGKSGVR